MVTHCEFTNKAFISIYNEWILYYMKYLTTAIVRNRWIEGWIEKYVTKQVNMFFVHIR